MRAVVADAAGGPRIQSDVDTLVSCLDSQAAQRPQQTAFSMLGNDGEVAQSLTYEQLATRARQIAVAMRQRCRPGDRVLLVLPSGLDYIASFYGALYAGLVAVPAFPPRPNRKATRVTTIASDCSATLAITHRTVLDGLEKSSADAEFVRQVDWMLIDELPAGELEEWTAPEVLPQSIAFLQYTSGSTASPKGVMLSHANLLHNNAASQIATGWTHEDVAISWLPLFHDFGLIGMVLHTVFAGSRCYLMSPEAFLFSPVRWLQAISAFGGTIAGGPNFAWEACVRRVTEDQKAALDLTSWRVAINGAEPIRRQSIEAFSEAFEPCGYSPQAMFPCYGLAEATLFVTGPDHATPPVVLEMDADALDRGRAVIATKGTVRARSYVGCGKPHPTQDVRIVDPETCRECASDQVGEIWVSGPSVASGYWENPEATEQAFGGYLADTGDGPYLRTGDLGVFVDDELLIVSRLKDLMIVNGENYYPQDLELTVQQSHPELAGTTVAAFAADLEGQERPIIAAEVPRQILPRGRDAMSIDEVLKPIGRQVRRAIADEHDLTVQGIVFVKPLSLPRTSSGKIQRRQCRADFENQTLLVLGQF